MVDSRLPPHDNEAERALLSACMSYPAAYDRVAGICEPQDFYMVAHELVFEAITALAARNQPIDLILVADELGRHGHVETVGGIEFLATLACSADSAARADRYAAIVQRDAIYRRMINAGAAITALAYERDDNVAQSLAAAQALLSLTQRNAPGRGWRSVATIIAERRAELEARAMHPERARGIPTYLAALDNLLSGHGILPGKTYVIGAMTSVGKSVFLRTILRNMALAGTHVGLLTLEQDEEEVIEELAYGIAEIDRHQHERDAQPLSPQEQARFLTVLDQLQELHTFHVDDTPGITVSDARLRMIKLKQQHNVSVIGADYLHILRPDRSKGKDAGREREIASMAEVLRDTAKELNVGFLLASQLNFETLRPERARNEFRPTLRDFRDSGAVTHLPYAVMGLHRRDYLVEKGFLEAKEWMLANGEAALKGEPGAVPRPDHILETLLLKQQRGPTGSARLYFNGALSQIADLHTPDYEGVFA